MIKLTKQKKVFNEKEFLIEQILNNLLTQGKKYSRKPLTSITKNTSNMMICFMNEVFY
jgi:hypothetical protein